MAVPFDGSKGETYEKAVSELKQLVAQDAVAVDGLRLSEMIRGLAVQLEDSTCDIPSLHRQIMEKFLQGLVDSTLENFTQSMGQNPAEYDPEFKMDFAEGLKNFEEVVQKLSLAEVAAPFAQQLEIGLEALVAKRQRVNEELGDSIANWREVLRRGCELLETRRIGARFVVQRKQDLKPFLTSSEIIHLDPPVCLERKRSKILSGI